MNSKGNKVLKIRIDLVHKLLLVHYCLQWPVCVTEVNLTISNMKSQSNTFDFSDGESSRFNSGPRRLFELK